MNELDALVPILETLALDTLHEPDMPIAVSLQEANDLRATLEVDDTWDRLVAIGVDPAALDGLPVAVAAARQAQSKWVVVRDRGKPQAQRDREQAGVELRSELVAACRWNLRHDAKAQAVIDGILQGDGVPDLVQDMLDLAALIDEHVESFDGDETFDATAQVEAARSLAEEITAGLSESRTPGDHQAAKLLRDRAYTHLSRLVADVREAGRYAFRKEPKRAAAFGSTYQRKKKARWRRRAAEQPTSEGGGVAAQ